MSGGLYKRDACSGQVKSTDYNLGLHVAALFIILGVSGGACALPLFVSRFPIRGFFFTVRHFGTGVLLATAFVHLLPTAFLSLSNPCLPKFWTEDYPAMPGAIALAGVLVVTVLEMILSPSRHFVPQRRPRGRLASVSENEVQLDALRSDLAATDVTLTTTETEVKVVLTPEQERKKSMLQVFMLEIGILFHSVFIGMALSVATGGDFVVLLIAIAFHPIDWPARSPRPYLMVLAYGCTTPIGQAIGIGTHTLYDPDSVFGLLLVGIMNAISSGLLIYASLIELLAEDFLTDHSWAVLRGRKRVVAVALVFAGALAMSVVGAWA
ncbi:plasma membrane zinc ion transporter, putative [Trichosporon asahii var. asahii CBS 8904]|uniref:Plasma membrane zinc ion transporter, putative n=2 Tax=Trichosporon asahii var. asahii TaxID=189963 RepID=K1VP30_TRIAC|nr:plasma membrane zinc ion transporter, putative [Trichosporon asahii var. asahii CBS 2479]EJT50172.1 plasma membrane zinc ion transporter, putative [Trichosporon asahii var. asahii CBS 2479]EKD01197.1 plasma membrane zinc ion transporter, putative [Trichosporon asahii var. asahii CBS 8904]